MIWPDLPWSFLVFVAHLRYHDHMSAFAQLLEGMAAGRNWHLMGHNDKVRELLASVYDERCDKGKRYRDKFQIRSNMQPDTDESASYAGWITGNNPDSGPYQGTSFVWMPGEGGSVAVLVIGTDGFGSDEQILSRPGHARRLRALARLHQGKAWVKPDLLDLSSRVPDPVSSTWPGIPAAIDTYGNVIYAAVPVRPDANSQVAVADLLDLFFHEHGAPLKGDFAKRWERRLGAIVGAIFPAVSVDEILRLLRQRRFVILEGPPGTGKTRLAYQVADEIGSSTKIQFHPARTYEDFVVGLFPKPVDRGLAFEVRPGDLLRANQQAARGEHVLLIDEINRADLSRVLGESIVLFEVGERRDIELPYTPEGFGERLRLSPNLFVLGTRNTADRTIARMDLAIRRRFAFREVWPDRKAVADEGIELAQQCFDDSIFTFCEYADNETLRLVPGHAYFLDPRPDLDIEGRAERVARRLKLELLPLLRDYVSERLCGGAGQEISGLADHIETRLLENAAR